ncbi:MAG: hypothetical protein L0241_25060 [Planctomycetia bacterium]|nr:hypothetical protein [Planctomycetia bacterium]
MISRPPVWVAELARRFWTAVGDPPPFPRDLRLVVSWLPNLHFVEVPHLSLTSAATHFARRNIPFPTTEPDRPLSGCFGASSGISLILIDSAQEQAEQRVALAHELGHYLRDYQEPRRKATERLGPTVLEVLDGVRPPTVEERLVGALRGVTVGCHTHFLERDFWGRAITSAAQEAEAAADRLALELLVPVDAITSTVLATDPNTLIPLLVTEFGLSPAFADKYAAILLPAHFSQKFFPRFAKY